MHPLVQQALAKARSQLGVREVGDNAGKKVESYLRSVGLGPHYPWCAAFVYWSIHNAASDAGVETPFIRTAACAEINCWAKEHELLHSTPAAGDVFLRYGTVDGVFRACHTGFVVDVLGSSFKTIEGNTNLSGSRVGIGVFELTRQTGDCYKFVRWGDTLQPETTTYALYLNDKLITDMPVRQGRAFCPVRDWGRSLGFEIGWDNEEQAPLLDGKEISAEVVIIGGKAYAPVRVLAEAAGLHLDVNPANRKVIVTRS